MKVLGLVGSPRREGNTDLLVNAILFGAGAAGHLTEKIYLYDIKIEPCLDCAGCKTNGGKCVVSDRMKGVYPKLSEADVIVFGTPLYWYGPSAKMKLLIDRLRPFISSGKLKGKRAVLVIPSEEGAEACRSLVDMFERSFEYLQVPIVGKILAQASEKGEIRKQPKLLDEAFALGKSL
jgi:multimeric flavodoxin WrbA